jgi:hypothetical protein
MIPALRNYQMQLKYFYNVRIMAFILLQDEDVTKEHLRKCSSVMDRIINGWVLTRHCPRSNFGGADGSEDCEDLGLGGQLDFCELCVKQGS